MNARNAITAAVLVMLTVNPGCVRRTVSINTDPTGAVVWLNDEEVGRTPVSTDFLWYGDYDVVVRKDGYKTLVTYRNIPKPWYQWPVIAFFAEVLYPGDVHDEHSMSFALEPEDLPDRESLLQNAGTFRAEALTQTQ